MVKSRRAESRYRPPASRTTSANTTAVVQGEPRESADAINRQPFHPPIDAVVGNQPASDLHEFDKIDLIAIGRLPRVFPNQQAATIRQPFPGAVPAHEFIGAPPSAFLEKPAQFFAPAQDPVLLVIEDGGYERALEDGVLAVEREQALRIARSGALVPLVKHPRANGVEIARRLLILPSIHFSHPVYCGGTA